MQNSIFISTPKLSRYLSLLSLLLSLYSGDDLHLRERSEEMLENPPKDSEVENYPGEEYQIMSMADLGIFEIIEKTKRQR